MSFLVKKNGVTKFAKLTKFIFIKTEEFKIYTKMHKMELHTVYDGKIFDYVDQSFSSGGVRPTRGPQLQF